MPAPQDGKIIAKSWREVFKVIDLKGKTPDRKLTELIRTTRSQEP